MTGSKYEPTGRGDARAPGESPFALIVMTVILGIGVLGLGTAAIVQMIAGGAEGILGLAGFFLAVALAGFLYTLIIRRRHLRDVLYGNVVERERWSPDIP